MLQKSHAIYCNNVTVNCMELSRILTLTVQANCVPLMNNTVSVNNAHFILIDPVEGLLFFTKILVDKITFLMLSDQPRQEAP